VRDSTEIAVWAAPNSPVTPLAYAILLLGGVGAAARQVEGWDGVVPADGLERVRAGVGLEPAERSGAESVDEPVATVDADFGPVGPMDADGTPKPTLIADETRALRMLDEHDGRLPQSAVVDRTEWSKSKVSRLLSRMEDDDQIKKITIGRKNLVTRPPDKPLETVRGRSDD